MRTGSDNQVQYKQEHCNQDIIKKLKITAVTFATLQQEKNTQTKSISLFPTESSLQQFFYPPPPPSPPPSFFGIFGNVNSPSLKRRQVNSNYAQMFERTKSNNYLSFIICYKILLFLVDELLQFLHWRQVHLQISVSHKITAYISIFNLFKLIELWSDYQKHINQIILNRITL